MNFECIWETSNLVVPGSYAVLEKQLKGDTLIKGKTICGGSLVLCGVGNVPAHAEMRV